MVINRIFVSIKLENMKKIVSLLFMGLMAVNSFAQNALKSDPAHSRIQFSVTHLGISEITGNFEKATLNMNVDEKNFTNSKINFVVDVNSINTHIEARDNHLRNEDFFDVKKFPEMVFQGTSIKAIKKNLYQVAGNLTLHGVTKPVTVNMLYKGMVVNPMSKKKTYGYQVVGVIKRSDFGIGGGYPEAMISDKVQIKGDFEMIAE